MEILNQTETSRAYLKGQHLFVSQKTDQFRRYRFSEEMSAQMAPAFAALPAENLDPCIAEILGLAQQFGLTRYYQVAVQDGN